jgi:hypothetical protein
MSVDEFAGVQDDSGTRSMRQWPVRRDLLRLDKS